MAAGLPWYVENIATDFYSAYHRWDPAHEPNWRFTLAQKRLLQDPDDEAVFRRDLSFADPVWQKRIRDRLIATVHEQSRFHPLYYDLGDETGIADLSAVFDFDLSPGSLEGMRAWLRQNYGTLTALNAEWDTHFIRWEDVRPETTRQAMRRSDDNSPHGRTSRPGWMWRSPARCVWAPMRCMKLILSAGRDRRCADPRLGRL